MSNIREIEVNGTKYGIESVNDMYVGYSEPTEEVKPGIWLKPSGIWDLQGSIGLEHKTGSTSSYGDYTLDDEGNLVETTDQTEATGARTTKLCALFKNKSYSLKITQNSGTATAGQLYTWEVYFYDINKQFISKSTGTLPSGESYHAGQSIVEFVLPENARYIRVKFPYSKVWYASIVDDEAGVTFNEGGYGDSSSVGIFKYDEDAYVRIW